MGSKTPASKSEKGVLGNLIYSWFVKRRGHNLESVIGIGSEGKFWELNPPPERPGTVSR
jgi:hypothetical protein